MVAEPREVDEEEEEGATGGRLDGDTDDWRAASSMLTDARSSCAVMSSREKLEASWGRAWGPEARTVEAGETRVLLPALRLPPPPLPFMLWLRPAGGFCRSLPPSLGTPRREEEWSEAEE